MRVIAGKYRSRQLVPISGDNVRPTTDKVKESIFGSIQFDVADSVFVDLFAGSGAMGIEALSRGARKVYFVDDSRASIEIVKKNIANIKLDMTDDYVLLNRDYRSALAEIKEKADIIFIDPPYRDKPLLQILKIVEEKNLLAVDGKIIYEHLHADGMMEIPSPFYIDRSKKYGTVAVEVIKRK